MHITNTLQYSCVLCYMLNGPDAPILSRNTKELNILLYDYMHKHEHDVTWSYQINICTIFHSCRLRGCTRKRARWQCTHPWSHRTTAWVSRTTVGRRTIFVSPTSRETFQCFFHLALVVPDFKLKYCDRKYYAKPCLKGNTRAKSRKK